MGMLPLRACALAFCASCLAFAFTPASTLIAPHGATSRMEWEEVVKFLLEREG
jgi:hypothetical protein